MKLMLHTAATALILALLTYIVFHKKNQQHKLLIGILSSRDNFIQRDIIRNGLLKGAGNQSVTFKFIVAKQPCLIPFESRIDKYKCEQASGSENGESYLHNIYQDIKEPVHSEFQYSIQGIDFDLLHDVEVTGLGFMDFNRDGINSSVKVILYDRVTFDPVIAILFLPFAQGKLVENFRFKNCQKLFLQKGFKGSLVVENSEIAPLYFTSSCNISSLFGIINGLRFGQNPGNFPPNFLKHKSCPIVATMSILTNLSTISKNSSYLTKMSQEQQKLSIEVDKFNDILLVDTEEVYRNLPRKMLLFYQWASTQDFGFMLKTDDDCYVNVNGILTFLKSIELFNISNLWIGNFRENFAIDRHGKWAEHDFQAVSYPPFACGSGYLLSKDLVEWIALNHGRLNFYQGEDTSLGIWLTSIYPNRIQDERFKCARTCEENLFSLPENNIKQLEYFYSNGHNSFSCNETIN